MWKHKEIMARVFLCFFLVTYVHILCTLNNSPIVHLLFVVKDCGLGLENP